LLGLGGIVALGAILDILAISVKGLVILALPDIIFRDVKKMGRVRLGGIFEGEPRKGLVQIAEALGKLEDDLHGHRGVVLNELAVLVFLYRNEGNIGQRLGGFDMTVRGHGGNNAEKIAGAQNIPPFLFHHFHFFGYPYLPLTDNKKPVGVLLAFDYNI
jgi:hypothetical protein